ETTITYVVSRGPLQQLAVKLPTAGGPYRVESVEIEPKELKGLVRRWGPAGPVLLVELDRGLTPRTEAKVNVRLRAKLPAAAGPFRLAMPDLEPLGAGGRAATYQVTLDPLFHAQLLQSSQAPASGKDTPGEPAFAFAYRDRALVGKLRVLPQRPEIHVRSRQ